jgi:hypothetical protein
MFSGLQPTSALNGSAFSGALSICQKAIQRLPNDQSLMTDYSCDKNKNHCHTHKTHTRAVDHPPKMAAPRTSEEQVRAMSIVELRALVSELDDNASRKKENIAEEVLQAGLCGYLMDTDFN